MLLLLIITETFSLPTACLGVLLCYITRFSVIEIQGIGRRRDRNHSKEFASLKIAEPSIAQRVAISLGVEGLSCSSHQVMASTKSAASIFGKKPSVNIWLYQNFLKCQADFCSTRSNAGNLQEVVRPPANFQHWQALASG